jgi:hypothetical protein
MPIIKGAGGVQNEFGPSFIRTARPQPSNEWAKAYGGLADVNRVRGGHSFPTMIAPPSGVGGIKCQPRNLSFTSKHALRKELARYLPAGEGGSTGAKAIKAFVYSPSNRLRGGIYVAFEADNLGAPDPSFVVTPTWTLRAMSRNPETGREVALQQAYPTSGTKNLPDAYEFDSAVQLLRTDVTLQDTNFSVSYVAATERVTCWLICTWEPNTEMSDAERNSLYDQCSISFGQPVLITNTAA